MKFVLTLTVLLHAVPVWASFEREFVAAAYERIKHPVLYDGSYRVIDYPNGDVAPDRGVCTDVIIRSYRSIGVDLQRLVHEDMRAHFDEYPSSRLWGLHTTDTNIDHRRVPNLQVFLRRKGRELPVSTEASDYQPGDLVTWQLPPNNPHIGIVVDRKYWRTDNPMVVHNAGAGPVLEDFLFRYPITGHYRYVPEKYGKMTGR